MWDKFGATCSSSIRVEWMNLDVSYNLQDPLFIINSRLVGGANTPHQEMHNAFHLSVVSYQITDTFWKL